MKINVTLPFDQVDPPEEFLHPEAVVEVGATMERAGFSGCNVTDHPCPSGKWLDAGGHYAQDPFVMLSLVATATRTVRLQTGILVLPYRNPFITARAVATLDVFSGGRVTLGIGAGYLKGEYFALGVDFERRNEIVDEYIGALKAAWTQDEFSYKGTGYEARGSRILPRPLPSSAAADRRQLQSCDPARCRDGRRLEPVLHRPRRIHDVPHRSHDRREGSGRGDSIYERPLR
jgi:alkanesulfonate monooxygenase SsuD/methylene tetrahydromethanopterin reductase-like flavin-dependent oxidoreductase (luciferase family)